MSYEGCPVVFPTCKVCFAKLCQAGKTLEVSRLCVGSRVLLPDGEPGVLLEHISGSFAVEVATRDHPDGAWYRGDTVVTVVKTMVEQAHDYLYAEGGGHAL